VKKVLVSDCEGPISKNDNAFEITAHFVPNGDKLFTVISKYDDVVADVLKRPRYKAGDTLKLILPFLKAYGVTDGEMRKFASQNLILMANVRDLLQHVRNIADVFIVSTSYEHYIRALCQALNFPYKNCYCTKLSIDSCRITGEEKEKLMEIAQKIVQMSLIEIPLRAKSLRDFSEKNQETIRQLDEIFWNEIASMESGRFFFSAVNPVGGNEKAEAVKNAVKKVGATLEDVMYIGDSITDVEAFRLIKEGGGLTVSFNGNNYAVKNAEIAILSESSIVTAVIADVFCYFGKQQVLRLIENWGRGTLNESSVNPVLTERLLAMYPGKLPKVKIVTSENIELLARLSSEFRKRVRGEAIGRLG
jgi:energy-converting hydrogenase A subunit R